MSGWKRVEKRKRDSNPEKGAIMKDHITHYPAPQPMPLSWVNDDPKMQKNEELSEKLKCRIYRTKEFSNTEINEYFLVGETDTYHILFNRDMGSCSCKGFTYNTGAAAVPCEHLMKVRSVEASGIEIEKPPGHLLDIVKAAKSPKGKTTYICKGCGKETDKEQAEKSFDELGDIRCSGCYQKLKETTKGEKSPPKPKKKEEKLPAKQEPGKPPAKKKTDAEIDAEIELAKAERFLRQRGSHYRAQGEDRPDAHMIQKVANKRGICIEILEAQQTDDFAEVVVRGHLGDIFVDAVVHHDFRTEYQLKAIEIVAKNPSILDHWDEKGPVIKEGARVIVKENGEDVPKDAKYFLVHALLSFRKFALRDARTKAASIAEAMLLNQDFRDPEERESEQSEAALVQVSNKNKQAAKAEA